MTSPSGNAYMAGQDGDRRGNPPDSGSGGICLSLVIVDSYFINWGTTQGRLSLPTADMLSNVGWYPVCQLKCINHHCSVVSWDDVTIRDVTRPPFKRRQPFPSLSFPSSPYPYSPPLLLFPLSLLPLPCPLPLSFLCPSLPLEVGPLNSARESGGALWAPPVGSGAEPQPKSNLVQFIWRLVSGGNNNFNDFAENQLTKFRAVFHPAVGCRDDDARRFAW